MDEKSIEKGLMYERQNYVEYCKPGSMLSQVLVLNPDKTRLEGLRQEDGMLIFQTKQKLEICEEYFRKVYSVIKLHPKDMEAFIFKAVLSELESEHMEILERDIQEEKIKQAISHLKLNKSSGPGGLTQNSTSLVIN